MMIEDQPTVQVPESARDLTRGERLLVLRRRHGLRQNAEARARGISLYRYRAWELDMGDAPKVGIGALRPHERLFIARRRYGVSLRDLADESGLSVNWICRIERGDAPPEALERFWLGD